MDNILNKIDADKEILSTMPRNNKKNIANYIQKVEELQQEYKEVNDEIFSEMEKRYTKIVSIKENKSIEEQKQEIEKIEEILEILDTAKTSYEKMGIDKRIYKLSKFYKENLESINEEIYKCIKKFSEVGVALTADDFDYSIYVNEYMNSFFKEMEKGNINSEEIKNIFEQIYWKCPDIIIHIELNLRYLYMKNQKNIDKYYEIKRERLQKRLGETPEEILNKEENLKIKLEQEIDTDKFLIIQKFLDGTLDTKDYEETRIKAEYIKLIPEEMLVPSKEEIDINSIKFLNSLYEYKNYLKFKYIYEDVKKKYLDIDQHKNSYSSIKKEIESKEKKLKKINKNINRQRLFGNKSKQEKDIAEYNSTILEIKSLYKNLDTEEIYVKIAKNISKNSSIFDTLQFASKFYSYLVECIIENNKDITPPQIEELIDELRNFVKNPNIIIIKNITILEEKNIPIIISDRYRLLNFQITKDDISETNFDSLISSLQKIKNYHNIKESNIDLNDMEFICEFNKILNTK